MVDRALMLGGAGVAGLVLYSEWKKKEHFQEGKERWDLLPLAEMEAIAASRGRWSKFGPPKFLAEDVVKLENLWKYRAVVADAWGFDNGQHPIAAAEEMMKLGLMNPITLRTIKKTFIAAMRVPKTTFLVAVTPPNELFKVMTDLDGTPWDSQGGDARLTAYESQAVFGAVDECAGYVQKKMAWEPTAWQDTVQAFGNLTGDMVEWIGEAAGRFVGGFLSNPIALAALALGSFAAYRYFFPGGLHGV